MNWIGLVSLLYGFQVQAQYSDDFDDAATIGHWEIFESGNPVYYENLMLHDSLIEGGMLTGTAGRLVMICGATYWYANVTGPYVYQMTWGDFIATTSVRSLNRDNVLVPPEREYNSTGLIVRDPDVTLGQNYVMTNLGFQSNANQIGSESKTTINSMSTLFLDPDMHEGEVRIQRTGTMIRTYKRTAGDTAFVLLDEFNRPDIPDTVQIGMVLNGYTNNPDIRGEFEYIHFEGGDCRIVRNGNDVGTSSLREAIDCAISGDTITFDHVVLNDTVEISSPLVIDKNLVILNASSDQVVIAGANLTALIEITPTANVTLTGIHLNSSGNAGQFTIQNHGVLALNDCTVSGNVELASIIENTGVLLINGHSVIR